MKKSVIGIFLLGILLVSPLVLAQEQTQVYSGFDRFIDNVKMFFSSADGKVDLSLQIREKELNSAIVNAKNGEDKEAEKNLERARERLQYVQTRVSETTAEKVKNNVNETIRKINQGGNLSESFEVYTLEEEKTQLTAELVIVVEGKEGQTLTREIVTDNSTGKKIVKIVVEGEEGESEVTVATSEAMDIEKRINEIDNEIVVKEVRIKENEDVSPKPNIVDNDVAPGPQGIVGNQGGSSSGGEDSGSGDSSSGGDSGSSEEGSGDESSGDSGSPSTESSGGGEGDVSE